MAVVEQPNVVVLWFVVDLAEPGLPNRLPAWRPLHGRASFGVGVHDSGS